MSDDNSAADAWAQGTDAGIGGWYSPTQNPSLDDIFWFHLHIKREDVPQEIDDLQRMIASLETLAQVVLIVVTQHIRTGTRTCVTLPLNTDNTPTEGAVNKLYSIKEPMKSYFQLLAWQCLRLQVVPVARHLPGVKNTWADMISRITRTF